MAFTTTARRLVLSLVVLASAGSAQAALDGLVVVNSGLSQPLALTAPAGDSRSFVVEKTGAIRVISGGVLQATPFLDLSTRVNTAGERGLLGMAFDPNYATNGRFYVNYIDATTLNTVVARYQVSAPGASTANAASAQVIISIPQQSDSNHKGGWIGFRPGDADNLYIATGDGGGSNDPNGNAQNPQSLLGKMLRLDVSGSGTGYAIDPSNPFAASGTTRAEIWALGLRNPFRNSFDRTTGDFWIADVGQSAREEINFELASDPGGRNYGWDLREGTIATPGVGGTAPGLTDPIFDYTRLGTPGGLGNTIIGGYVYRGPSLAEANGRYFFGDYIANAVYSFVFDGSGLPTDLRNDTASFLGGTGLTALSAFGEDGLGRLYAVGGNGVVVMLVPEPGTTLMLLLGLAGVGLTMAARRRRA